MSLCGWRRNPARSNDALDQKAASRKHASRSRPATKKSNVVRILPYYYHQSASTGTGTASNRRQPMYQTVNNCTIRNDICTIHLCYLAALLLYTNAHIHFRCIERRKRIRATRRRIDFFFLPSFWEHSKIPKFQDSRQKFAE